MDKKLLCKTCFYYNKYVNCEDLGLCLGQNSKYYLNNVFENDSCKHHYSRPNLKGGK